ncbi:GNAT family N-acetyltransferase [Celerinatantimonas yamalensis]|uniref:GNAT family N-acetyltransferase n=1 Tax=Celerinatantimonas yamalensis TaxID=559956 RepID=A0ABW9G562_9GAMM
MIETDRLILRKPNIDDLDIFSTILSCPTQTKFLPNEAPYSKEQQNDYLVNRINHWDVNDFGTFIICLSENPEVKLGFVGAEYAPNPDYVDIRFGIAREFEGQCYISEAAKALVTWFFENTKHSKLYGVSVHENVASKAVLRKLGMIAEKDVDLYQREGLDNFSIVASNA